MVELIQILGTIIALFAISRAILRYKDHKLTLRGLLFWSLIWVGVILIVFYQPATFYISRLVGVERGIDFFIYLGIVILFYLVFKLYIKIESIEQDITKVVRAVALRKNKKK